MAEICLVIAENKLVHGGVVVGWWGGWEVNIMIALASLKPIKNSNYRIPPRFPPDLWNVRDATVNGDARTNNICESWNSRYSSLVAVNHPIFWRAVKFLKREEAASQTKLEQYRIGRLPPKKTKRIYIQQQNRLRNLCLEFSVGRMNMANFLTGIAHNIHLGND